MENNLRQLLENYRRAEQALRLFRQANYPTGKAVIVDAEKYHGQGIVDADSLCPITKIPVRLENGNVWYYDMSDCNQKADLTQMERGHDNRSMTCGIFHDWKPETEIGITYECLCEVCGRQFKLPSENAPHRCGCGVPKMQP